MISFFFFLNVFIVFLKLIFYLDKNANFFTVSKPSSFYINSFVIPKNYLNFLYCHKIVTFIPQFPSLIFISICLLGS